MVGYRKESKNLVIVMTPLQACIVLKLMQGEKFDVIYLSSVHNSKNYNYYLNLSKKSIFKKYYRISFSNKFNSIHDYIRISTLIKKEKLVYDNVYLGSIHDRYAQLVLSKLKFNNLYTFDDGFANINYEGIFYQKKRWNIRDYLWKLLGNKYDMEKIKAMSCLHFSIYPNILNIIDNVKFISIYDKSKTSSFDVGSEVSFFLGQPLFELDKKFNSIYIENLLLKIKADFYFPHPRENYSFKKIKIVDSNLIFEDYLLQYMEKNPSKKIILYSFFSTVFLNINHENVKKIAIYDDCLGERYKKIYEIMIDFNVVLKPVEEIND